MQGVGGGCAGDVTGAVFVVETAEVGLGGGGEAPFEGVGSGDAVAGIREGWDEPVVGGVAVGGVVGDEGPLGADVHGLAVVGPDVGLLVGGEHEAGAEGGAAGGGAVGKQGEAGGEEPLGGVPTAGGRGGDAVEGFPVGEPEGHVGVVRDERAEGADFEGVGVVEGVAGAVEEGVVGGAAPVDGLGGGRGGGNQEPDAEEEREE